MFIGTPYYPSLIKAKLRPQIRSNFGRKIQKKCNTDYFGAFIFSLFKLFGWSKIPCLFKSLIIVNQSIFNKWGERKWDVTQMKIWSLLIKKNNGCISSYDMFNIFLGIFVILWRWPEWKLTCLYQVTSWLRFQMLTCGYHFVLS